MKDNYTYPVIFERREEGGVLITFPCFDDQCTFAGRDQDPVKEAQDWLALNINDCECEGEEVPSENLPEDYETEEGQRLVYVNVWMPYHRSSIRVTYTKKTLTIPVWLDMLARQNNINFSETLTQALKQKLNIQSE